MSEGKHDTGQFATRSSHDILVTVLSQKQTYKYYMGRKLVAMKERFHKTTVKSHSGDIAHVHFNNWERRGHNRQLKSKYFNPRDDFLKTGV